MLVTAKANDDLRSKTDEVAETNVMLTDLEGKVGLGATSASGERFLQVQLFRYLIA